MGLHPFTSGRSATALPPPRLPLGTSGAFDNPPVAIWGVVFCRDDGVFTAHGTLLKAISHRKVAGTGIDMYTYWSVGGVAEFSVQVHPPPMGWGFAALSAGTQWRITSWEHPLPACVQVSNDRSRLVLHATGMDDWQLVANRPSNKASSYRVVDEHRRTMATIERTPAGWKCQQYADLPMTTQRLLYVAARWADQRYKSAPRRQRWGDRRERSTDDPEASVNDDE